MNDRSTVRQMDNTFPATPAGRLPTAVPAWARALPLWVVLSASLGLCLILLVMAISFVQANGRSQEAIRSIQALQTAQAQPTPVAMPTTRPACEDEAGPIEELRQAIQAGRYALAAEMADLDLARRQPPACPDARAALAGFGYTASLEALFADKHLDGQAAVERWQEAERRADTYGLGEDVRWSPMQVATRAYDRGLWELARAAIGKAWETGQVNRQDPDVLGLYYASLYNGGIGLAESPEGRPARQPGLVLLRTADALNAAYGLGRGEAHQALVRLLGPDSSTWPAPDSSDAILAAKE